MIGKSIGRGAADGGGWIPAFAGMTWVCAGMTWEGEGMTWEGAGMMWAGWE